jgi:hypothetical protein
MGRDGSAVPGVEAQEIASPDLEEGAVVVVSGPGNSANGIATAAPNECLQ